MADTVTRMQDGVNESDIEHGDFLMDVELCEMGVGNGGDAALSDSELWEALEAENGRA